MLLTDSLLTCIATCTLVYRTVQSPFAYDMRNESDNGLVYAYCKTPRDLILNRNVLVDKLCVKALGA